MEFPVDEGTNSYMAMNNTNNNASRRFSYSIANKEISFQQGRYNGGADNTYVIPLYVWGIK